MSWVDCTVPHLAARLFAVCAELGRGRDEWQRLWTLTSPDSEGDTPADREWIHYDRNIWPGREDGPAPLLVNHHPRIPEGLAAKAAAVCAMDDATVYSGDCRDDAAQLWESVARDAEGAAYRPLGRRRRDGPSLSSR